MRVSSEAGSFEPRRKGPDPGPADGRHRLVVSFVRNQEFYCDKAASADALANFPSS